MRITVCPEGSFDTNKEFGYSVAAFSAFFQDSVGRIVNFVAKALDE